MSTRNLCFVISAICGVTGCGGAESSPAGVDAGAAADAASACTPPAESARLGAAGAVLDPVAEVLSLDGRVFVAWKQLGGTPDEALWINAVSAGEPPPGAPGLLAEQPPFGRRSQPVLLPREGGLLAVWHQATGTGELDIEVRQRPLDLSGQPAGAEAPLSQEREALSWQGTPRDPGSAWLWTIVLDANAFRLTDLAQPDLAPVEWPIGQTLEVANNLRMNRLADDAVALVYESGEEGVFYQRFAGPPRAISTPGVRLGTAPKLERRPRRSRELLVVGREDLLEEPDRSVIGFILFDDSGAVLAEPVVAERTIDGGPSLHYVDTHFIGDEIRIYWVERAPDEDAPNHNILDLYHARFTRSGQPIGGPELLQRLDSHPEDFEYNELLDSGTEVMVAPVGGYLAIVYGVGFYEPVPGRPDDFVFAGTDLYLAWRCL